MRHRHGLAKLNRTSTHRKAMLVNMSNSLIRHERISTTLPKAKALRRVVEPLITLGKRPSLANRRLAFSRLRDRESVMKIFDELGPRYQSRPGGYVRILKDGFRKGDNAPMALVELMDRAVAQGTEAEAAPPAADPAPKAAPSSDETPAPALPDNVMTPEPQEADPAPETPAGDLPEQEGAAGQETGPEEPETPPVDPAGQEDETKPPQQ